VTNGVDNAESAEPVTLVRKALERLDSTDRKLLLMLLVEGLKPGAIAARLGLKVELVRQPAGSAERARELR
jgi:DNA-directed RNA polymerase specialized sigma24 family protein